MNPLFPHVIVNSRTLSLPKWPAVQSVDTLSAAGHPGRSLWRLIGSMLCVSVLATLAACGSSSSTGSNDSPKISDADIEVDSYKGLPSCTEKREGTTAYVVDQEQGYVCENGKWVEDDAAVEIRSSSSKEAENISSCVDKTEMGEVSSSSAENLLSSSSKENSLDSDSLKSDSLKSADTLVFYKVTYEADPLDFVNSGVIEIKDGSISGLAQKGPFLQGSTYKITNLDAITLNPVGESILISSDKKGEFSFSGLNMPSQYATIVSEGLFLDELTGENSKSKISLSAIIDLQRKSNINIITTLENERIKHLVLEENFNVLGAKKRAFSEILAAFHIKNFSGTADQLDLTKGGNENAALLAISILFLETSKTEGDLSSLIDNFKNEIKNDGLYTSKKIRAKMADAVYSADSAGNLSNYRHNIEQWNISDTVPLFELFVSNFWSSEYNLGECNERFVGNISVNQNSASSRSGSSFICDSIWYSYAYKKSGFMYKLPENDKIFAKKEYRWRYIGRFELDNLYNPCDVLGVIVFENDIHYICAESKNGKKWRVASPEEVDKYYTECTQDGKLLKFGDNKYYKCSNEKFIQASSLDSAFGQGCVSYLEGKTNDRYNFICSEDAWVWNGTYEMLTDKRDGKTYKAITIGTQTWMAENLNFEYIVNDFPYKNYCYRNDEDMCKMYGRFYTYSAAMDSAGIYSKNGVGCNEFASSCSPKYPVRGVCPESWHLPTSDEWDALKTVLGGLDSAEMIMKSTTGWNDEKNGTDAYGFNILPAGIVVETTGSVDSRRMGLSAYFWTSSRLSVLFGEKAYGLYADRSSAYSVRCVKD